MQKVRIEYDSPIDALIALAKRLSLYEDRFGISSEMFFERYHKGKMDDSADFVEWAGDYQHFLALKYDDTPHFPTLPSFPHHKHLRQAVIASERPPIASVFEEAKQLLQK